MTPLHWIGKLLHGILSEIPLDIINVIFIAIPGMLIIWVFRLPKEVTISPGPSRQPLWKDLKFWASIALFMQFLIYLLF